MKNQYTVSEIANLFNISSQTLRYYDKIGLLKPVAIEAHSNYRIYSQEEINRLYLIRELKGTGLSLTEIGEYCANKDIIKLDELLIKNRKELETKIHQLNQMKNNTDFYLQTIKRAKRVYQENVFSIQNIKDRFAYYIGINFSVGDLREYIELLHKSYSKTCSEKIPKEHGHVVLFIDEMNLEQRKFKMYNGIGLLLERRTVGKNVLLIKGGEYAQTSHIGKYETIHSTYMKLYRFIEKEGYTVAGPSAEISVTNTAFTNHDEEFITEVQIPVKKLFQA